MNGLLIFALIVCFIVNNSEGIESIDPFAKDISKSINFATTNRWNEAKDILEQILKVEPKHFDANQLYGSVLLNGGQYDAAVQYFEAAFFVRFPNELHMFHNYIDALRLSGRTDLARENAKIILEKLGDTRIRSPHEASFFASYAKVEQSAGNWESAIKLAETAVNTNLEDVSGWNLLIDILSASGNNPMAESIARKYLQLYGNNVEILCRLGMTMQFQLRLDEALVVYKEAEKLAPNSPHVLSCLGAVYQQLGLAMDAYYYYQRAIPLLPYQAAVRNNFGALLGSMSFREHEIYWLQEAIRLDPSMSQVSMNLAGYYQDEGDISTAVEYLQRLPRNSDDYGNVDIRVATMLSPIPLSWEEMVQQRWLMSGRLSAILNGPSSAGQSDNSLDHMHFYLSFHGLNDRPMQELVSKVYSHRLKDASFYSPMILQTNNIVQYLLTQEQRSQNALAISSPNQIYGRRVRIGFISKFFGVFEPHGMLLDGIMKYLPRSQFEVVCFFVARTDFKEVAPNILEACDERHQLSLASRHVLAFIQTVQLDCLVFADIISEPISHFLTYARLASVQIAFWGNPMTTGSSTMDYFLTGDVMEHPYRTRIPLHEDSYSEQVWLLEGQGIWYFRPVDPDEEIIKAHMSHLVGKSVTYTRSDFNLPSKESGSFLYLLPQSTFKIHPLYDLVLREILAGNEHIHIAVTGGRRPSWTTRYLHRLRYNIGPEYAKRLHVIDRVSSENFYSLLALADGVLHPFPFDGSRTSADALIVNIPFVTLPTEYLRGRMGFSFYRTMNISELVAVDIQDYVDIALRLVQDQSFYQLMKQQIANRVDLIWEDMSVPFQATQFFQRLFSIPVSRSYEQYLRIESGRSLHITSGTVTSNTDIATQDIQRSHLRSTNQAAFDQSYGKRQTVRREYTYRTLQQALKSSTITNFVEQELATSRKVLGSWELDEKSLMASLEGNITLTSMGETSAWPRVFEHWRRLRAAEKRPLFVPSFRDIPPVPTTATSKDAAEKFNPFPLDFSINSNEQSPSSSKETSTKETAAPIVAANTDKTLDIKVNYSPDPPAATVKSSISISSTENNIGKKFNSLVDEKLHRFYSYGISISDATSQLLVDSLQQFRLNVARGQYQSALHLILQLQSQGLELPTYNPVFNIELGMVHLFLGDNAQALEFCRTAYAQNTSMVNALGCIGVSLIYFPDTASKQEASRVLYQALEKQIELLSYEVEHLKEQYPDITDEDKLLDMIDARTWSATGMSVVSMPIDSLMFNYIASLVNLQEFDKCVETFTSFFRLPPATQGGSHAVIMANIRWSETGYDVIRELFPPELDLIKLIRRLQDRAPLLLSNMGICLSAGVTYKPAFRAAFEDVGEIIERVHRSQKLRAIEMTSKLSITSPVKTATDRAPAITVLTQYFVSDSEETQYALDYVLARNLANPAIDEVHILTEQNVMPYLQQRLVPSLLQKLRQKVIGKRLTFATAFQYANDYLSDRLVALSNADIFFDESLYRILYATQHQNLSASAFSSHEILSEQLDNKDSNSLSWKARSFPANTVLALLRWHRQTSGEITLSVRTDSQDVWIFRPPLAPLLIQTSDFLLGVPRCDNRLVYLLQQLQYKVHNPAFDVHAIEYQTPASSVREGLYGMKDSVPGEVSMLLVDDSLPL